MKLRIEQLNAHLRSNTLAPCFLISGEEALLMDEVCQAIRKTARQQGFTERQVYQVDNHFSWQEFLLHTDNYSLFSAKTLLELHIPNNKINAEAATVLQQYANSPANNKLLLLKMGKLEASTQKSKWVQALEKNGIFVQIWPVTAEQMPAWIRQRLQQAGLTIEPEALRTLTEFVEGNLSAASQEIEKLHLIYGENYHLKLQDILNVVENNSRYDVFQLIDAILAMDVKKVSKILFLLQQEGEEPVLVLWAITREIRTLITLCNKLQTGHGFTEILRQLGVWEKRQLLVKNYMRTLLEYIYSSKAMLNPAKQNSDASIKDVVASAKLCMNYLQQALQIASQLDQIIKGLMPGNIWDELLKLCLFLQGKWPMDAKENE